MEAKSLKDFMIPLAEYAVVDEDTTLVGALKALDKAQENLKEGKFLHRAVLVKNKYGQITGKFGHFSFLKAYISDENWMLDDPILFRSGVSNDMLEVSKHGLHLMDNEISNNLNVLRNRAATIKVKFFMSKDNLFIDENATLLEAIKMFVKYHTLSIMVTRNNGREVEGVLRVADVFDELANNLREKGKSNGKDTSNQ